MTVPSSLVRAGERASGRAVTNNYVGGVERRFLDSFIHPSIHPSARPFIPASISVIRVFVSFCVRSFARSSARPLVVRSPTNTDSEQWTQRMTAMRIIVTDYDETALTFLPPRRGYAHNTPSARASNRATDRSVRPSVRPQRTDG